jgi:response regulator RpfG family c-di-GMP phosphodiesterase
MENELINVLYVDDEINNLIAFKATFRKEFNVHTALSAEEGRKILDENRIHVMLTDQRMPGTTGVEFLEAVLPYHPDTMRILLTGFADIQAVIDAVNRGQIYKYISKPWGEEELRSAILSAYEVYRIREVNKNLNEQLMTTIEKLEFLLRQKEIS